MTHHSLLRRFLKDEGGATIVEFAVVSVVFFMLMCAIIEYGLIMFTKIAIESATQETSRSTGIDAAVSGCSTRPCAIQKLIADKTLGIVNPAKILITSKVITAPTDTPPAQPDVCNDTPGVYYPPTCVSWQENNGTGGYQQNNINSGNTDDLVQISVFYQWQVMFPIMKPFFTGGVVNMTSSTVVRNEPF